VVGNIGNLASHCMLATLGDDDDDTSSQRVSASAVLSRPGGKLGLSAGTGRDTLPAWLSSGRGTGRVEQNDLAVFGQKNIGREGFVSIGGAVAKACRSAAPWPRPPWCPPPTCPPWRTVGTAAA